MNMNYLIIVCILCLIFEIMSFIYVRKLEKEYDKLEIENHTCKEILKTYGFDYDERYKDLK